MNVCNNPTLHLPNKGGGIMPPPLGKGSPFWHPLQGVTILVSPSGEGIRLIRTPRFVGATHTNVDRHSVLRRYAMRNEGSGLSQLLCRKFQGVCKLHTRPVAPLQQLYDKVGGFRNKQGAGGPETEFFRITRFLQYIDTAAK